MAKKIIAAGHICIDLTPVFPKGKRYTDVRELLEPGKLIHTQQADIHTGGSVANTGLALKLLGVDVQLMGKVGDDAFGAMVQQILQQHGAGGLIVDPQSQTSYTVVIAIPGIDRIFLHNPGANDTFSNQDIPEEDLEDAVLFHLGYPPLMKKMYEQDGAELTAIFQRMKARGIATSLDFAAIDPSSEAGAANWRRILEQVLPYVDFFVPSFEELCFMLDRDRHECLASAGGDMTEALDMERDVKPLAEELLKLGCKVVLIKCGTSGMYCRTASGEVLAHIGERLELDVKSWADREIVQPIVPVEPVLSSAGAGDTSIAAFLAALLRGDVPERCTALAAAEGACCVTAYDSLSGLKPLDELEQLLK
jgi:sugar/nucleoside kinase (ribokinase family)